MKKYIIILLMLLGVNCYACDDLHMTFQGYAHAMSNNVIYTYQKVSDGYKSCQIIFPSNKVFKPLPKNMTILVAVEGLHTPYEKNGVVYYDKCNK
jgi:hypothetical protein